MEGSSQPLGFPVLLNVPIYPFREVKRANAVYNIDNEIGPDATADFRSS